MDKFAVFVFCWGRPEFNDTLSSLRKHGYTGRVYLLCDDLDKTSSEYQNKYGYDNVFVFNKHYVARQSDPMNNFGNLDSTLYVENAMFGIAKELGLDYFCAMCDDVLFFHTNSKNVSVSANVLMRFSNYLLSIL